MSCQKIITINVTIMVVGENGTEKWFTSYNQFCFEDIEKITNRCISCSVDFQKRIYDHYRVVIDEEDFYIPDWACAHDDRKREEWEVNARALDEHENTQPSDWKKAWFEASGIDITKTEKVQCNGQWIYDALRKGDTYNNEINKSNS